MKDFSAFLDMRRYNNQAHINKIAPYLRQFWENLVHINKIEISENIYLKTCSASFFCKTAAKSLQSCPTLCDPIDGSPPGSPIPGILQARTLGCHFLLRCMKVKSEREVAQSCLTLCDPMDCSPPGSSVHGIFQARVPEWVAIAFSSSPPKWSQIVIEGSWWLKTQATSWKWWRWGNSEVAPKRFPRILWDPQGWSA